MVWLGLEDLAPFLGDKSSFNFNTSNKTGSLMAWEQSTQWVHHARSGCVPVSHGIMSGHISHNQGTSKVLLPVYSLCRDHAFRFRFLHGRQPIFQLVMSNVCQKKAARGDTVHPPDPVNGRKCMAANAWLLPCICGRAAWLCHALAAQAKMVSWFVFFHDGALE